MVMGVKKMKKGIFSLLVLLMLLGLMTACSSNEAGGNDNDKDKDKEEKTITFWRHDYGPESKAIELLIESFEKEYPNIKIKFEEFHNDQYETKIRTALSSGDAPDIMAIDAPFIASYAENGAVISLNKYMEDDDYQKDDIFKPVMEAMTYSGDVYAAPNNDASLAIFYNIKMFEEKGIPLPPQDPTEAWTWEQYVDVAKQL